jgi:hypothetical protein
VLVLELQSLVERYRLMDVEVGGEGGGARVAVVTAPIGTQSTHAHISSLVDAAVKWHVMPRTPPLCLQALSEQNHELREEVMRLQAENMALGRSVAEGSQRARQVSEVVVVRA